MEIRVIVYREQTSVLLFYDEDEAATANGSVSVGEERKRKEATDAYRGYKEIIKANASTNISSSTPKVTNGRKTHIRVL